MTTKLHTDFLGPYVVANGAIVRPMGDTSISIENVSQARHILYTPDVRVRTKDGHEEVWTSCGDHWAYEGAKRTLSQPDFEKFVTMATSLAIIDKGPVALARYPQAAALHPAGAMDLHGAAVSEHMAQAKALSKSYCASLPEPEEALARRARQLVKQAEQRSSTGIVQRITARKPVRSVTPDLSPARLWPMSRPTIRLSSPVPLKSSGPISGDDLPVFTRARGIKP